MPFKRPSLLWNEACSPIGISAKAQVGMKILEEMKITLFILSLPSTLVTYLDPHLTMNLRRRLHKLPNDHCADDNRELSKRRTKTLVNTCSPQWNQSFVYPGIRPSDLRSRVLEVTVWDYDRFGANEFLGEVCLDLGSMLTTGQDVEPVWHSLSIHENGSGLVRTPGIPGNGTYRRKAGYPRFLSSYVLCVELNSPSSALLGPIVMNKCLHE